MRNFFVFLLVVTLIPVLSFSQTRGGDIYGTVVLADGSRIPGVAITISGNFGKKTTLTSEQGNFRFLDLAPGSYDLKCELEGFKTFIQKSVEVALGKTVTLNVMMETTTLQEEVTVSGKVNIIDTRKTTVGVNVTKEMVDSIPTARNPWTVLSAVPGIVLDRVDVGGADSGQQSNFMAGGGDQADTTWNVDGANITDPSSIGASPAYLNVNNYGEVQVTLGANDITAQTGGVQLNFVSKRAGNATSGDFHLYVEDKNWEMTQDRTPEMISRDLVVPGVNRLYQYGINLGGAIVKDKVWWYGSWAIQDIHKRTETDIEDATWLVSGSAKINFQFGNTTGDFHMSVDSKKKWGRTTLSPSQQDNGSLWDQDGPGYFYYGGISHVFGELMLNAKLVYSDGGFILDPRGSSINPETGHLEGVETLNLDGYSRLTGSYLQYSTNRNSIDASVDGNYFMEGVLGGDHEIKFGVDYYTATTTSQSLYTNQRMAYVYTDGSPNFLRINPDYIVDVDFKRISAYVQDTITFGKLTASIGLRYDKEKGKVNPFTSPYFTWYEPGSAHHNQRMFEEQISALDVKGVDVPAAWELISPRISLTYDITGNGKNVLKLSAGRYMSQNGNNMATRYIQYRYGYADWTDLNHDNTPQFEEVGELFYDDRFQKVNPSTSLVNVEFSEDYNTPYLDEVTLIFEKSLGEDIAASVTGFYKKKTNLAFIPNARGEIINVSKGLMANGQVETKENWVNTGTFVVGGTTVPVWDQQDVPLGEYFYNLKDANQEYLGIQLRFTKKLSNNWMADASFTFSDWKLNLEKNELLNLNNFDFFNGSQVAPATTGSGLRDVWINSSWMFKINGMYQLPWGMNLTGFFQAKEGGPQPLRRNYGANQGTERMYRAGYKVGDERLPTFWMLNLGLEKTLKVSDTVTATLVVDWYNATNNQIVLKHELGIGETTPTGDPTPTMWSSAGLFQFGIRVNF